MLKLISLFAVLVVVVLAVVLSGRDPQAATVEPASHVGAATCAACHEQEHRSWSGSHHDLAMQPATEATVLGNFDEQTFTHFGVTSTFFRKDGGYYVRTEGPDGELTDYPIKYCFGVTPLQQYLIEFPGGRLQSLGLCWDSRTEAAGGQRWFHLYPDEKISHDDPLHWTAHVQTWNHQCASCHSTNLRRNYDLSQDSYHTTWSEMNVACEACHGPGSNHVAWAEALDRGGETDPGTNRGLVVRMPAQGSWVFEPGAVIAKREPPLPAQTQLDTCAPCHSRRTPLSDQPALGQAFLDDHLPATLDEGLYHADGQILDEVYVWGSFVQSKMHRAGVTCSDCHDPHSLQLRATGNALCVRCHLATEFDRPTHHFHAEGSPGSQCVECHMPAHTYMVVDPRRDHGFRVPRPDLTVEIGTPNACTGCHADQPAQWAADAVAKWFPDRKWPPHFGQALHAARTGQAGADRALLGLTADGTQPAIARATAIGLLGPAVEPILPSALRDPDPLVRRAAVIALEDVDPRLAVAVAAALVKDPMRSVRLEAARILDRAGARDAELVTTLPPAEREAWRAAMAEGAAALQFNGDQPWAHVNDGLTRLAHDDLDGAERAYRTALRIDPSSIQASTNLADLYRQQKRDDLAEEVLRAALSHHPDSPELSHSLGLTLVRGRRYTEAVPFLESAAVGRPESVRFGYVFAIALHEVGDVDGSIQELERLRAASPTNRQVLEALVHYCGQRGHEDAARRYSEQLRSLDQAERR